MPKSQLEWSVDWTRPITLAALTQRIYEEGLGRADLVALLEDRDRELCDELCGRWYHPRQGSRYRRAGGKRRTLGTRFGKISLRVRRVLDTVTGETVTPLWKDVLLDGGRVYQPDVIALAEQFSERMTYRDAREELGKVVFGVPSPRTVNRRVIEDGNLLNEAIRQREMAVGAIIPDGTKLHAKGGKLHDVNITLATAPGERPRLRCLTVGAPWEAHRETLAHTSFEDAEGTPIPPTVICDQERGLAEAMTPPGGRWQPGPCAHRAEHGVLALAGWPQGRSREGGRGWHRQWPPRASSEQRGVPPSSRGDRGGGPSGPADDEGVPPAGHKAVERRLLEDGDDAAPGKRSGDDVRIAGAAGDHGALDLERRRAVDGDSEQAGEAQMDELDDEREPGAPHASRRESGGAENAH